MFWKFFPPADTSAEKLRDTIVHEIDVTCPLKAIVIFIMKMRPGQNFAHCILASFKFVVFLVFPLDASVSPALDCFIDEVIHLSRKKAAVEASGCTNENRSWSCLHEKRDNLLSVLLRINARPTWDR
mmetsp:Transcript_82419/g.231191  ORF Transcript_82419/g.231191 Transcript_82419/m.231191 type:complete len:127 (-) Transcript_82419:948-1328(-)